MRQNPTLPTLLVVLFLLLSAGAPAVLADEGTLYDEVLRMLEAELSEEVIGDWLAGAGTPPRPSAEQLIALKEAGASDQLLRHLLALSSDAAPKVREALPRRLEERPAPPPIRPEPGPDAVPVTFELIYQPDFDDDNPEWELYLYLDGRPLTYVPMGSALVKRKPLVFIDHLEPGTHLLRIAQERHERRGRERWFHAARFADLELPLEIDAGEPVRVELSFRQGAFRFGGTDPLTYRVTQGAEVHQRLEEVGGDPEDWPLLCEEIESNFDGEPSRRQRRELEGCRRWSSFWREEPAMDRREVREALALYGYRPIPR